MTDSGYFTTFTLIIASNIQPELERRLASHLWNGAAFHVTHTESTDAFMLFLTLWSLAASATVGGLDIPLISIRNSGFIGRVQVQLQEHCGTYLVLCIPMDNPAHRCSVVDTHPDTTHTLRIDQPFPALEQYARELDMDAMDSMDYSHVPWVVLLVRTGCAWKDGVSWK